jgi:catechol 2,3-dioxygenase-like lactoylglutathione lyase family enzyme
MPVQLNHTIVAARDAEASARWFADLFGVAAPQRFGHFWQVETANGVALDYASVGEDQEIAGQHYAFLVSEDDFDAIFGRVLTEGLEHWADPMARRPDQINHNDGGRGVYFRSPDGHFLEIITRPYGSGS